MNVNKININQSEQTYYIASDIYDVSYHNNDTAFSSLSELLNAENLSTLIPIAVRCGGMSIRFIQSSDNKYVQYRLMSDTFNTTVSNWQGLDDEPTVGSDNLVKSGGINKSISFSESETIIDLLSSSKSISITKRIKTFVDGYYINSAGEEIANINSSCTDFITIEDGEDKAIIVTNAIMLTRIVFYSSDKKTVVSQYNHNSKPYSGLPNYIVDIPSNASFLRVSNYIDDNVNINIRGLYSPIVALGTYMKSAILAVDFSEIKAENGLFTNIVLESGRVLRVSLKNSVGTNRDGVTEAVIVGDGSTICKNLPINILKNDDSDFDANQNGVLKAADINDFILYDTVIITDGSTMTFKNCVATDFIEIPNGFKYIFLGVSIFSAASVCVYDENYNKLQTYQKTSIGKWVQISEGAKYFRACNLYITNSYAEGIQKPIILLSDENGFSLPIKKKFDSVLANVIDDKELNQRITEIYASRQKYVISKRINSDDFTPGGYIGQDGVPVIDVNKNFLYTPEFIAIDDIYANKLCTYINSVALISIAFYTEQTHESVIDTTRCYSRMITGISSFELDIPQGAKYVKLSAISNESIDNNIYPITNPYVIICEDNLGLSDTKKINELKINHNYKDIDFSNALPGYYKSDGTITLNGAGMYYIDKVDVELYNRLYIQLSSYANGNVLIEFGQDMNVLHVHKNEINNVSELSEGTVIALDSKTRFIGISTIGNPNTNNHKVLNYSDKEYYKYYKQLAFLFREDNDVKEYSDSMIEVLRITEDDFTDIGYYVGSDGIRTKWSNNGSMTDYIDVSNYSYLLIKRHSSIALLAMAFYSQPNESSLEYTLKSSQISTINGEKTYKLRDNANYVRISWMRLDTPINDVTTYAVKPHIEFYNYSAETRIEKSPIVYNPSFFGNIGFAKFDDFDYSQILCYGQSFADGGGSTGGSNEVIENAYMLGNNTRATSGALGQLGVGSSREFPVIGCVNALANLFNRRKPHKFIASTGGGNGRCISAMSKGTNFFNDMETMFTNIKAAVDNENKSVGLAAIFFLQGESDYTPNTVDKDIYTNDKDEYKRRLLQLKNDLQDLAVEKYGQTYRPLFFVYQTSWSWIRNDSYTGSDNVTCPISMAQFELAQEYDDVILMTPCYFISIYDNNHPSINGYRWIGEMAAKAMYQAIEMDINYSNTKIVNVSYSQDKVFVDCYCPVLPLQIRTLETPAYTDYGFQVRENGVEVPISDISINGSQIVITLSKTLDSSNTHDLSYAGRYRGGRGNICDSDRWISTLNYLDDTNDGTIVQRPKNPDGTNIFGQKYPMFNYLGVYYGEF